MSGTPLPICRECATEGDDEAGMLESELEVPAHALVVKLGPARDGVGVVPLACGSSNALLPRGLSPSDSELNERSPPCNSGAGCRECVRFIPPLFVARGSGFAELLGSKSSRKNQIKPSKNKNNNEKKIVEILNLDRTFESG